MFSKCCNNPKLVVNAWEQSVHLCLASLLIITEPCCSFWWVFSAFWPVKMSGHNGHWVSRVSCCLRVWREREVDVVNVSGHSLHLKVLLLDILVFCWSLIIVFQVIRFNLSWTCSFRTAFAIELCKVKQETKLYSKNRIYCNYDTSFQYDWWNIFLTTTELIGNFSL